MKAMIVTPTFNEKDNMPGLIEGVLAVDDDVHIVIVDDRSPDGTAEVVKSYAARHPRVHLIEHMPKGGRGFADRAGMFYALEEGAELILQMDADLSHQPKYLSDFLKAAESADVVIGSRLVAGGKIEGRNAWRDTVTMIANTYIRVVLGLKVRDCTSGFRCYRRRVLEKIQVGEMFSPGPSLLEEILYAADRAGFVITEIPITFVDRKFGRSKLTAAELFYIAWLMLKIRGKNL